MDKTIDLGGLAAVWGALAMKHVQQEPRAPGAHGAQLLLHQTGSLFTGWRKKHPFFGDLEPVVKSSPV